MTWRLKWENENNKRGVEFYYEVLLPQGNVREEDLEPELGPFYIYIEYFFELDTCRSSISNGPISFTDIHNFATIKEIEDFDEFHYLMRKLDKVIVKHRDKKNGTNNSN